MPIFEYRCTECGAECEVFVRGSEQPVCPGCQSAKLEKLMSAPVGHVSGGSGSLPIMGCPPSDAPPCRPGCCRIPQ